MMVRRRRPIVASVNQDRKKIAPSLPMTCTCYIYWVETRMRTLTFGHIYRYDNYLNDSNPASRQSGYGNLGMGLLSGDMDDDSDEETLACSPDSIKQKDKDIGKRMSYEEQKRLQPVPAVPAIPLMAPKPGYAAQVSALELARPMQAASPPHQRDHHPQMSQMPGRGMPIASPYGHPPSPRAAFTPPTMPSTPHPLQPPPTPIIPAFARPPKADIKFAQEPAIMRGKSEEAPLRKRGEKGDEFWKRFSMVVKEETSNRYQKRFVSCSRFAPTPRTRSLICLLF